MAEPAAVDAGAGRVSLEASGETRDAVEVGAAVEVEDVLTIGEDGVGPFAVAQPISRPAEQVIIRRQGLRCINLPPELAFAM